VIGPCNLESGEKDPLEALSDFDTDRARILREAQLQDSIHLDSFVNCITRNFSIKRRHLSGDLFDEAFGYSASPESGFGWEDVEMGYRLYKRGLRIHFTEEAFSVHVSHPSTTDDGLKPLKSLKNYRRLLEKHPTIKDEARRWCLDTFQKIEKWSESCGHAVNADQLRLREIVSPMYPYPFAIGKNRGLRVLTYRWHVPHQYELYKLPYQFSLVRDAGTHFVAVWEPEQRPRPRNATFVNLEEVRPQDYDLAILHFDENVLSPENCNGIIGSDWGASFRWGLERLAGIPKVAVCHGTPQFIGQYQATCAPSELGVVIEESRKLLVDRLGDTLVVCNSYQAEREWGFRRSRVIWQGFDPSEFGLTDYTGGVVSLGKSIKERPHYRGYENFRRVSEILSEEMRPCHFSVGRPSLFSVDQPEYARLKYEAYKAAIRSYSVYFNPTLRSPMPRSRGEAMMSGLATVSAANHDVQLFIKNGWNGFYADSPEEMAEQIRFLMRNKNECKKIGERGHQTAIDVFNHDRYLHAWQTLVSEIVGR
jgi:glycosyltransferase involved in cell wall biosynthesis